jgi:WD40 repeat protein
MSEFTRTLERAAERYPQPDLDLESVLSRHHRLQRNQRLKAASVGIAVALAVMGFGYRLIRADSRQIVPTSPSRPAPLRSMRMHNGPVEVFGFTDGVRKLDSNGLGGFVVKCHGSCTETTGADWSPDGKLLAFSTACGGSCATAGDPYHGLRIFDPKSGTDKLIVFGEGIAGVAWSPDGRRIAYWTYRATSHIIVVNADGSDRIQLSATLDSPQGRLSWAPDGSQLAYSSGGSVYVIGLDGSGPTAIASGSYPAWSPDGKTIAYLVGCEVRSITPAGLNDHPIVDLAKLRLGGKNCYSAGGHDNLAFSPDGAKLIALIQGGYGQAVFILNSDGRNARIFASGKAFSYLGLTWQPVP